MKRVFTVGMAGLFLALTIIAIGIGPGSATAAPIAFGQTIYTGLCSTTHTYTFDAVPSNRVYARLTMCSDYGAACTPNICKFDQRLQIFDPGGAEMLTVVTPLNHNCCACRNMINTGPVRLYDPGTYSVAVSDYDGSGGGTYALFLQDLTSPGRADTLYLGAPLIGTLSSCGEVDTYVFNVTAGDSVHLVVTNGTGNIDPKIEVFDDQGMMLTYPGSNEFSLRSPTERSYRLLVYSGNGNAGTYTTGVTTPTRPTSWGQLKVLYR